MAILNKITTSLLQNVLHKFLHGLWAIWFPTSGIRAKCRSFGYMRYMICRIRSDSSNQCSQFISFGPHVEPKRSLVSFRSKFWTISAKMVRNINFALKCVISFLSFSFWKMSNFKGAICNFWKLKPFLLEKPFWPFGVLRPLSFRRRRRKKKGPLLLSLDFDKKRRKIPAKSKTPLSV